MALLAGIASGWLWEGGRPAFRGAFASGDGGGACRPLRWWNSIGSQRIEGGVQPALEY